MIPEQALKAGAYAMFKRSIETLPPEKQALYGSWYEHNEAGANEEFEIAAGIIIQAALPHLEAALRKQIAEEEQRAFSQATRRRSAEVTTARIVEEGTFE